MMDLTVKQIETEEELQKVLELCYRVLGEWNNELYGYDAWRERWKNGLQPLVYAAKDSHVVSAILGRAENKDSLIIGFVACHEQYRRQGITQRLMEYFETLAKEKGFRYITLGSREDAFYEKCGYQIKFRNGEQNIFQKRL